TSGSDSHTLRFQQPMGYVGGLQEGDNIEVTATGASAARTLADRFADVIHVKDFGAVGDGVADDTAAINAAIAYMRDRVEQPDILGRRHYVDGSGGLYRVNGSINATGLVLGRNWGLRNLLIDAHCSGKVVLDLTGSRFGHL